MRSIYIPKFLQNAIFGLLLFAPAASKKTRNRAGYYSLFSKQQTQKSTRPKPSILKELGYSLLLVIFVSDSYAFSWADLWLTKDQQAQKLMSKGQFKQAETTFKHDNWRAAAAYRAGDFEQAAKQYQLLANGQGYYNQGNALAHLGEYEKAIKAYNQALTINPANKDALFNRDLLEDFLKKNKNQQNQNNQQQQNKEQQDKNQPNKNQANNDQQNQNQTDKNQQEQNQANKDQQNQNQTDKNQQEQNQANKDQQNQNQTDKNQQEQNQANKEQQNQNQRDKNQQEQNQTNKKPSEQTKEQQNKETNNAQSAKEIEKQQAKEQWLRLIPDDPGGLMREKFMRDHLRREGGWYQ